MVGTNLWHGGFDMFKLYTTRSTHWIGRSGTTRTTIATVPNTRLPDCTEQGRDLRHRLHSLGTLVCFPFLQGGLIGFCPCSSRWPEASSFLFFPFFSVSFSLFLHLGAFPFFYVGLTVIDHTREPRRLSRTSFTIMIPCSDSTRPFFLPQLVISLT